MNPGSEEAIAQGCICPSFDNCHGAGVPQPDGTVAFWAHQDCPIHHNPTWDALRKAVGK